MKTGNNPSTAKAFVNYQEMKGSNLYSFGDICKSYNTIIASHTNGVILLTSYDYSNTTQRHKLHIKRAANCKLFEVPICYNWNGLTTDQHKKNLSYLLEQAETMEQKANKARIYGSSYRLIAEKYRQQAADYESIFEL